MNWLAGFGRDLRVGLRQLGKSPVFTGVVGASLALGTAANTAGFSLVNDLLLRSLPVRDPDQLVLFRNIEGEDPCSIASRESQVRSPPT